MGVKFIDETPPATKGVKFIDEQKQEPTVLERGKKVAEEALTSGIFGAAAPEMMQATGQGIKRIGQAAGPYGRIPTAVGSAIEAGGTAMKGARPASFFAGTIGGAGGRGASNTAANTGLYGGGGSGGYVATNGAGQVGGAGSQGVIFIVYSPSGTVINNKFFLLF